MALGSYEKHVGQVLASLPVRAQTVAGMWVLYQIAIVALLLVAAPVLFIRRGRHYLETLPARLGRLPPAGGDRPLWLHAASVGETTVAATLARSLPADLDLVVTSVTPTGQAEAKRLFGPLARNGRNVVVTYLPFDLGPWHERFLRRYSPRALVLLESELWPLLLRRCRRRGMPVLVLNTRISDRSFARMKRARRGVRRLLLDPVGRFGAQSPQDVERLLSLGASPAQVMLTGNLKFDSPEPPSIARLETALRRLAARRPIIVAGSTMPGEEEQVLEAFCRLGRDAMLILAPRHPERFEGAWRELKERALVALRRSLLAVGGNVERVALSAEDLQGEERDGAPPDAILLDTLGELASVYRLANVAFIGGTLVPTGGHNPIEAARFGVPVTVGPSMENFRRIAADFQAAEALTVVGDSAALSAAWRRLLDDSDAAAAQGGRGRDLVERNRGAVERSAALLRSQVDLS